MEKTRRDVLKLIGAAAGTSLLAACGTDLVTDEPGLQSSGAYQKFYVDSNSGNDDNSGTDAKKPVKTLQRALDLSHEYDAVPKILLRAGGYYSVGVISKYGSEDSPMTIDRWDEGDTPVISGAATMRDWERDSGSVYKKVTAEPAYALYVDGEEAPVSTFESRWLTIKSYDHNSGEIKLEGASVNSSVVGARVRVRVTKYAEQADRTVKALKGNDTLVLDEPLDKDLKFFDEKLGRYRQQLKLENGRGDAFLRDDDDWCCIEQADGSYIVYLYSSSNPSNKDIKRALQLDLLTLEETPEYLNINNVRFVAAGRNAITSKAGVKSIRVGNGCSFSRITKAGVYFYNAGKPSEDVVIGDVADPNDLDSYMQFDRCGIMVLLNNPKNPTVRFLAGRDIGLSGAAFNDKENAGVFSQLNGAIITTGYLSKTASENIAGGSIHNIDLTNIGGNGVAHNGFGTTIRDITGDQINQRLDDIAFVYCWSRSDEDSVRRTENVKITDITARNSSDVYEGWDYQGQKERLRVGVYVDNGVNRAVVERVKAEACFKGIFVNYFTRDNTVRYNDVTGCDQGIVVNERPSGNLVTGHTITDNTVRLDEDDHYAFLFWQDETFDVTYAKWENNTVEARSLTQKTILLKNAEKTETYTVGEFQAAEFGRGNEQVS